ncbi:MULTISPECIES: hypothetical protein [Mesorhizobium]|jgi:hypothetical protein|nr:MULTISPECIES: hypothetical protein [Mesorhizobium]MCQ8816970.1 hypothetical protein [Mesorhizobium sp. SEMIA396]MCQ8874489.1 hypothetical protein [Mesorhizobium sp. LMG17149]
MPNEKKEQRKSAAPCCSPAMARSFLEFSRRIPDLGACNTGAGR